MQDRSDLNSGRGVERGPTAGDPSVARTLHTTAVVTPEAVLLEFRAAGIASRVLAKGIDLILQFIGFYVVLLLSIFVAVGNETVAVIVVLVTTFLVFFGYPMIEAFWGGQTLGKKIMGIKVITIEGGPVGFRHAAIRSLVWIVEFLLPPGGLLALAAGLLTRRSQRVGDLAAGTVVVRSAKTAVAPLFFSPAYGAEQFGSTFDAGRIGPQHYALVREFLSRAHELTPQARAHVAIRLADGLVGVCGKPRPVEMHPEVYLVSAVFAVQRRFSNGQVPTSPPLVGAGVGGGGAATPPAPLPPPAPGTRR